MYASELSSYPVYAIKRHLSSQLHEPTLKLLLLCWFSQDCIILEGVIGS